MVDINHRQRTSRDAYQPPYWWSVPNGSYLAGTAHVLRIPLGDWYCGLLGATVRGRFRGHYHVSRRLFADWVKRPCVKQKGAQWSVTSSETGVP